MTFEPAASAPRIAPMPSEDWDEFLTRLVAASGGPDHALNIFTTLGRHAQLFRMWVSFGGALLSGALPARTRELAILRTSVDCEAEYEWVHHVDAAKAAGVTDVQLSQLRGPLDQGTWDPGDLAVLSAVDEMHGSWTLSDATWSALLGTLDDVQCIELVMLVGQYHLVALALRTLRIQIEADP